MAYFGEMKSAQLERRFHKMQDTVVQFLDPITYNNIRCGVYGFVNFSKHMLDVLWKEIEWFNKVPMLIGNQSCHCLVYSLKAYFDNWVYALMYDLTIGIKT